MANKTAYTDSKEAVGPASRVGKSAALATAAVLAVALVLMVWQVERLKDVLGGRDFDISALPDKLAPNADGTCVLTSSFELTNVAGRRLLLGSVQSAFPGNGGRFLARESGFSAGFVDPGNTVVAVATFELPQCPGTPAALGTPKITVNYSSNAYTDRTTTISPS